MKIYNKDYMTGFWNLVQIFQNHMQRNLSFLFHGAATVFEKVCQNKSNDDLFFGDKLHEVRERC